ncbi:MAG: M43 family zinc metalloprotease [Chitinophagales bacterium]
MKNFILTGLLIASISGYAQQQRCHTDEYLRELTADNLELKEQLKEAKQRLLERGKLQNTNRESGTTYVIPVVVHIVYSSSAQDIDDEQVFSQIEVLSEDYSRTNADAANTPDAFEDVADSPNIAFVLASFDPDGNPTTGITRTETDITSWNLFTTASSDNWAEKVKDSDEGGIDGWDRDCYLNIWVCNLSGGVLGYSSFPGFGTASRDGVVISYKYFGRDGSAVAPFDKGRTATHEVGHWLGVFHTWGDDDFDAEPQCSGSDEMADTPNQEDATYFCPSFPKTDDCTAVSPGIMFMNYMDYVDDDCMNMFTEDQVNRMHNTLEDEREELTTCTKAFTDIPAQQNSNWIYLDIFPNPVSNGIFTAFVNNPGEKELVLEIYNMEGKLLNKRSYAAASEHSVTVDLSKYADGVYMVRAFDGYNFFTKEVVLAK